MASKKRPTARTLELLRKEGFTAQVVERWQVVPNHPGGGVRQDLFGCIDVISIQGSCIVAIQCGAASGHSAHVKKCLAEPRSAEWLATGAKFEIHSWGQKVAKKVDGSKAKVPRWSCRIQQLVLGNNGKAKVFAAFEQPELEIDLT